MFSYDKQHIYSNEFIETFWKILDFEQEISLNEGKTMNTDLEHNYVDCTEQYCPPFVEAAAMKKEKVWVLDRKGNKKLEKPRLKHRKNLNKYIKDKSKLPYVNLTDINPSCGKDSIWGKVIDILKDSILTKYPEVIGYLNTLPVYKIPGFAESQNKCSDCGFNPICEFASEEIACIFRPSQYILWGTIKEGVFYEVDIPIVSSWMSDDSLLEYIEKNSPHLYEWFKDNNKDVDLSDALARHIATIQRVELNSYNCYGLPVLQCGMKINTRYNENARLAVQLVLGGIPKPIVASWKDAKKKYSKKIDKAIETVLTSENKTIEESLEELKELKECVKVVLEDSQKTNVTDVI